MNNNYDFLSEQPTPQQEVKAIPFDTASWKEKKQIEREFAFSTINNMTKKISHDMGDFQNYLNKQLQMEKYSVGNVMLILAQNPQATKLKDYNAWKDTGASVKPHSKSLIILEPTPEYVRDDGTTGTGFKTKAVFDVSQTFTKEQSQSPIAFDERSILKSLVQVSPVPIKAVDELTVTTMGAFYDNVKKEIYVRRGLSNAQFFQAVSQEVAHAKFDKGNYNRSDYGFKAYCTSYMLCGKYGIENSSFVFKDIPKEFLKEDVKEIRSELSKIRNTMQDLSDGMRANLEQEKKSKQKPYER